MVRNNNDGDIIVRSCGERPRGQNMMQTHVKSLWLKMMEVVDYRIFIK